MRQKQILVYSDKGVGPHAFRQLLVSLRAELSTDHYSIKAVDHRYLIDENWEEQTALLILPGGRDVHYHAYLQGAGNQKISSYVTNGGNYLGLCAGGYYGAAYIEFEMGGELEVHGARELAFFPGLARGPAYGNGLFCYESEKGARSALLHWEGGVSAVYFNGGCLFEAPESFPGVEILARYTDLPGAPAAILRCLIGKGRAVLSGTHPEYETPSSRPLWSYLLNSLLT